MIDHLINQPGNYENCYKNAEGFWTCKECGGVRQMRLDLIGKEIVVPCLCPCQAARRDAEEQRLKAEEMRQGISRLRRKGMTSPAYLACTFAADDSPHSKASQFCRRYVEQWPEMYRNNHGILLTGAVGTGKSFYAAAIANAVIDLGYPAIVTSAPRYMESLRMSRHPEEIIDSYARCSLLVLDDLGSERSTEYADERIFDLIDRRYLEQKPLIVTTNLSLEDLQHPQTDHEARTFDRVLELCNLHLSLGGTSRRKKITLNKIRDAATRLSRGGRK